MASTNTGICLLLRFIFPGLGLGVILAKAKYISDAMMMASAEALANYVSDDDLAAGKVYPDVADIRNVSRRIAVEVILHARKERNCDKMFYDLSEDEIEQYVETEMYQPRYAPLVYREPGKGE